MAARFLYSNGKKGDLTNGLMGLIRNAKKYVKISSFLMQDFEFVNELVEISKEGKIAIFVISNQKYQEGEEYGLVNQESSNRNGGFDNHTRFLKTLFYAGIHVRLLDNLHAKFVIADGEKAILMSANISHNSLNENIETGVELESADVPELESVFDNMFNHADIVRFQGARQMDATVRMTMKLDPVKLSGFKGRIRLTVCSNNPNTNLSDCNIQTIYDSIIEVINNANQYLYIATWHFKFYEDTLTEFKEALGSAIKRGVKVYLYSNTETPVNSLKQSIRCIRELRSMGCWTYGDGKNHSKCVLSESQGLIFTANIDSNSGLTNGFEVGYLLTKAQRQVASVKIKNFIQEADNNYKKKKNGRR